MEIVSPDLISTKTYLKEKRNIKNKIKEEKKAQMKDVMSLKFPEMLILLRDLQKKRKEKLLKTKTDGRSRSEI